MREETCNNMWPETSNGTLGGLLCIYHRITEYEGGGGGGGPKEPHLRSSIEYLERKSDAAISCTTLFD